MIRHEKVEGGLTMMDGTASFVTFNTSGEFIIS